MRNLEEQCMVNVKNHYDKYLEDIEEATRKGENTFKEEYKHWSSHRETISDACELEYITRDDLEG